MTAKAQHFPSLEAIHELPEFRGTRLETLQGQADGQWYRIGETNKRFRVTPASEVIPKRLRDKLPLHLELDRW